ncbi:MAG: B12-binding domain-containing radical SAM protein [Desulfatibacillaceae bacterium]
MNRAKRILLVNPAWRGIRRQKQPQFRRVWPPLSLAVTASMLEREGFFVTILDANARPCRGSDLFRAARAHDMVFVTSSPYDRWQCPALDIRYFFDACDYVPGDRLYVLGAHCTERPAAVLAATGARAAVMGEPEGTILEVARTGGADQDVPGTARLENGVLRKAPDRGFVADLDELPMPAFHRLPMNAYRYGPMGRRFAILEGSRGCPHGCTFCYLGMYGRRHRKKSPERVAAEAGYAALRRGVRNLYFMDLEFCLERSWVMEVCDRLARSPGGISWCCQTRVSDVDADLLQAMRRAGCSLIHFGVESGSDRILAATGKGIRVSDARRAVRLCREAGIRTAVFMNLGFPGETVEEMHQTVRLARELSATYTSFHLVVPFPGTRLAEDLGVDPDVLPAHLYPQFNEEHEIRRLKLRLVRAYAATCLRPSQLLSLARSGSGIATVRGPGAPR